jgi:negative regulator of sigma E activity
VSENEPTEFEKKTREVLEESASRLDGATRSRLTQARHAALAQLEKPERAWWRSYAPIGAAAAAVLAAVIITRRDDETTLASQDGDEFEDLELLADAEAPDFFDEHEDADFYEWAAGEIDDGTVDS